MARFWATWSVGLALLLALLIGVAGVVGRARGGEMLIYSTYHYDAQSTDVYLMDVTLRLSVHLVKIQGHVNYVVPNPHGGVAFLSCNVDETDCNLTLWENGVRHDLTDMYIAGNSAPSLTPDGRLGFTSCMNNQCDLLLWDGITIQNLTNTPDATERYPAWSADGQMAFQSCSCAQCNLLWDGERRNLTNSVRCI
ncbi:MAG: hypothetical protein U0694_17865 [Anaerolineae bacterium]